MIHRINSAHGAGMSYPQSWTHRPIVVGPDVMLVIVAGAQRPAEGAPLRGEVAGRGARLSMLPDGNHGETLNVGQA